MNTISFLKEKINNAKALDFGTIFSESIELFKKTWLQGFLMQLFVIIIMLPLIIVLYLPLITIMIAQAKSGYSDPGSYNEFFAGMSIIYILFVIIGIVVLSAVSVAINAAFFRIMRALDEGKAVTTSDFFCFINGKYLSKAFLLVVVSVLISIPAALLCYIPLIYVLVPMSFFAIIFAFNPELSVGDIVSISFKIGHKKWLLAFGLIIVSSLLAQIVGFLLCGIGVLFTAPFVYHPVYIIYKKVIGFNNEDEVNHIVE
ncbi:MAG: hypothetical protein DRI75_03660 [Bacteroidetes bacterium]|nr:MAG: hypothetical protein DRI75_03660 [Bacteroidota bacterium]